MVEVKDTFQMKRTKESLLAEYAPKMLEFIEVMAEIHDGRCHENVENLGRCRCHVPRALEILAMVNAQ